MIWESEQQIKQRVLSEIQTLVRGREDVLALAAARLDECSPLNDILNAVYVLREGV